MIVETVPLRTPAIDSQSLAGILHDTRAFILRYVVLSSTQATLSAVWVAMTHALPAFDYVAYLHVTSPMPECGKSRLLEALEALVVRPWLTGRVTAAVLMRKVDKEAPTLLLDESDAAFNGDPVYAESLRGMLNAGFHRSGKASVCVGQGAKIDYKDFSVFGPKAIAGIGRLPSTVESRSIPIKLRRRTKHEVIHKWRDRDGWAEGHAIHDRLTAALHGHLDILRQARPSMPHGLPDRAEDVLEPLFAIADLAGGEWPESVRQAAVALMGQSARTAQEADQSLPLELLADIRQVFDTHGNPAVLQTKVIIEALVGMEDRPWATFSKGDKPITGHRLARLLKGFDVQPAGAVRVGDEVRKGYRCDSFVDAFCRYLGSEALQGNKPNRNGPELPESEPLRERSVTDAKTAHDPDKHWGCNAVTLSSPDHENGRQPANPDTVSSGSIDATAPRTALNRSTKLDDDKTGTVGLSENGDDYLL